MHGLLLKLCVPFLAAEQKRKEMGTTEEAALGSSKAGL